MKLREALPKEFFLEHTTTTPRTFASQPQPTPAMALLDVEIKKEHSRLAEPMAFREWPGHQQNVHVWWELMDGSAVGWNENPTKGWSFPVLKPKELQHLTRFYRPENY